MTAIVATDVADTIWRISSSRWERRRWLYMPRAPSIAKHHRGEDEDPREGRLRVAGEVRGHLRRRTGQDEHGHVDEQRTSHPRAALPLEACGMRDGIAELRCRFVRRAFLAE